jgi:predicted short-subunit dehydrogenase-like oxidoreductase (DUF2520 family)
MKKRKAESGKRCLDVSDGFPLSAFRFPLLNIIGCGRVGKTLARLWTRHGVFRVGSILNRTLQSAARAAGFVGSGRAVGTYAGLEKADLVMISTSDEAIEGCCRQLCDAGVHGEGTVVFHCSGALASTVLEPARARGALIASIHPIKSFADPATAVESFPGTFCAIEGDPRACAVLSDALERCGGIPFAIEAQSKTIHHAATVLASNYLVALMELALRCFEHSGVTRETALRVLGPLAAGTISNVSQLGPIRALTGPIARGEASVVAAHCEALGQWDASVQDLYKALGRVTLDLAAAQGSATPEALAEIRSLLQQ